MSLLSLLALLFAATAAKYVHVPTELPSIGKAIQASGSGDTVVVHPGVYNGSDNCGLVLAGRTNFSLMGSPESQAATVIDCGGIARFVEIRGGQNVTIKGMTIRNGLSISRTFSRRIPRMRQKPLPRVPFKPVTVSVLTVTATPDGKLLFRRRTPLGKSRQTERTSLQEMGQKTKTRDAASIDSAGGGILVSNAYNVILGDLAVSNCSAINGSGIAIVNSAEVTVHSCNISQNGITREQAAGNSIFGGGAFILSSSVRIVSSEFSRNFIDSMGGTLHGGGISALDSKIHLNGNLMFSLNSLNSCGGAFGGAISILNASHVGLGVGSALTVTNNSLRACGGGEGRGGGIYMENVASPSIFGDIAILDNSIGTNTTATSSGAGLSLHLCSDFFFGGRIMIVSNRIESGGPGSVYGGGIYISRTRGATFVGLQLALNCLVATGIGKLRGGGLYASGSTEIVISQSLITQNSIKGVLSQETFRECLDDTESVTNITLSQCPPITAITQARGVLQTMAETYAPRQLCRWYFAGTSIQKALLVYRINIFHIGIESEPDCSFDWLAVFSGPNTLSPLLGKYCGDNSTGVVCSGGDCLPTDNILSLGGEVTIEFRSDRFMGSSGFGLSWEMVQPLNFQTRSPNSAGAETLIQDVIDIPLAMGGGLSTVSTSLLVALSTISRNSVDYFLLGIGGAIGVESFGSTLVSNCTLENNLVQGPVAGGGAVACDLGGVLTVFKSSISSNRALAAGPSFWAAGALQFRHALGGGALATDSTITFETAVISRNSAECAETDLSCTARGGGFSVGESGYVAVSRSTISENTCCSYLESLGAGIYGDSGVLFADTCTFQQNRFISVGSGGAAHAFGYFRMFFFLVDFSNNAAAEGGAVRARSLSASTFENCFFGGNTANFGGAVAATGLSVTRITGTNFTNNFAQQGSTLLSLIDSSEVSFSVANCTISGPTSTMPALLIGSVTVDALWLCSDNGSIYSVRNQSGFALEFVSCDHGAYSFGRAVYPGSLKDVCYECEVGSSCSDPTSPLALAGFWGSVDSVTGKATFTRCPNGQCCPHELAPCPFDYCVGHREGPLCGACPPGFGLQFFSTFCVKSEECQDAVWIVPLLVVAAMAVVAFLARLSAAFGIASSL